MFASNCGNVGRQNTTHTQPHTDTFRILCWVYFLVFIDAVFLASTEVSLQQNVQKAAKLDISTNKFHL